MNEEEHNCPFKIQHIHIKYIARRVVRKMQWVFTSAPKIKNERMILPNINSIQYITNIYIHTYTLMATKTSNTSVFEVLLRLKWCINGSKNLFSCPFYQIFIFSNSKYSITSRLLRLFARVIIPWVEHELVWNGGCPSMEVLQASPSFNGAWTKWFLVPWCPTK